MEEKREVTLYLSKDKNIPLIAATSGCKYDRFLKDIYLQTITLIYSIVNNFTIPVTPKMKTSKYNKSV